MFPSMTCSRHSEYVERFALVTRPQARHEEGGGRRRRRGARSSTSASCRDPCRYRSTAGRRDCAPDAGRARRAAADRSAGLRRAPVGEEEAAEADCSWETCYGACGSLTGQGSPQDPPATSNGIPPQFNPSIHPQCDGRVIDSPDGRRDFIVRESSPLLTSGVLRTRRGDAHVRLRPVARLARRTARRA